MGFTVTQVMKRETSEELEMIFLIADLSGYTALAGAHGNIPAAEIVTRYVEIIRSALHPGAKRSTLPHGWRPMRPVATFEVLKGPEKADAHLIDPVRRMQLKPDTAPARLPFGDSTYYFCSFDCVKSFVNHPDRYTRG